MVGRAQDGRIWVHLGVLDLVADPSLRKAVARCLFSSSAGAWPRVPLNEPPLLKGRGLLWEPRQRNEPVKATIVIDAYLTADVPKKLRERTFTIRSEGEALVRGADMYRRLYEENEKLGGDSALDPDVKKRVAKRKRAQKRAGIKGRGVLINRGFEHYIWGHDIGDLVFESMHFKWSTDKTNCRVTFGIGS